MNKDNRDTTSSTAREKRNEKHIKRLRSENRRLKSENNALKHEIEQLTSNGKSFSKKNEYSNIFSKNAQHSHLFQKKNFPSYMLGLIRNTTFFHVYSGIINAFRKYSFFKITFSILSAIFIFIESSAVFVISASFFIVSIPITLFISNLTIIVSHFNTRKKIAQSRTALENKKITVFFPSKKSQLWGDTYQNGFIKDTAKNENSFCIIVSPYVFKTSGVTAEKSHVYYTSRAEYDNVLIVRRHYYFTLRKRVLSRLNSNDITEIY